MIRFSHEANSWMVNLCINDNSKWHPISVDKARWFFDKGYVMASY